MSQRQQWAELPDALLLAQCNVDTYRASGPGGQKRNKTSSAVRLRHEPSGIIVIAEESRSQHENKARAVRRLRQALWLDLREPPDLASPALAAVRGQDGRLAMGYRDSRYLPAVAIILDVFESTGAAVRDAAAMLGTTTGNLVNFLSADDRVWRAVNALRVKHQQTPLLS